MGETETHRIASDLSYEDFIETYALRGRPVVLKGGASLCFEEGRAWGREDLRKEAGGKVGFVAIAMVTSRKKKMSSWRLC